ncbi:MAG: hypothetical protein AAGA97_03715 [Pseudomonadota bacterium]
MSHVGHHHWKNDHGLVEISVSARFLAQRNHLYLRSLLQNTAWV